MRNLGTLYWVAVILALTVSGAAIMVSKDHEIAALKADKVNLRSQLEFGKIKTVAPIYIVPVGQKTPVQLERMAYGYENSKGFPWTKVLACGEVDYDAKGSRGDYGRPVNVVNSKGELLGIVQGEIH